MCAPGLSAIAGVGMSVLSAGASYQAKMDDYHAKIAEWRQNIVNSEAAARDEYGQIVGNQLIQQAKIGQQEQLSEIDEAQKRSSVAAAAAEGGVSGISVDNVLQDITGKALMQRNYAALNYKFVVADTTNKLKAATDQEQSRINSIPVPQQPSAMAEFAQVGTAGIKAFSSLGPSFGGFSGGGMSLGDT